MIEVTLLKSANSDTISMIVTKGQKTLTGAFTGAVYKPYQFTEMACDLATYFPGSEVVISIGTIRKVTPAKFLQMLEEEDMA